MSDEFRVYAFKVAPAKGSGKLSDLLKYVNGQQLESRVVEISSKSYRLEHLKEDSALGLWFLDFSRLSSGHGPGKASKKTPTTGFKFEPGEEFSEETACLYVPARKALLVQYNHSGPRAGAIADYLNSYPADATYAWEFEPKYDEDIEQKFAKRAATRRVTFAIDTRYLTDADRSAGVSLASALDIGANTGGTRIQLTISASNESKSFLKKGFDKTIANLKKLAETNPDAVSKLKVTFAENLDEKLQIADLLAQRLSKTLTDVKADLDHRIPRSRRYEALLRVYNGWTGTL
jgi:hypothetical protein